MAASRDTRSDAGTASPLGAAAARGTAQTIRHFVEIGAPWTAGALLLGLGVCGSAAALGLPLPAGPLAGSSLTVALLITAAGVSMILATWEVQQSRRRVARARREFSAMQAQRDAALTQARKARSQADGLALIREIHRSTALPDRNERLHRILTLLADLFEVREVSLFAAGPRERGVCPAACLRVTGKEELFVAFDTEELGRMQESGAPAASGASPDSWLGGGRVAKGSTTIVREGAQLSVHGVLEQDSVSVARIQWRPGVQGSPERLSVQDPSEILETALTRIEFGVRACALANQALERRRTIRIDSPSPQNRANDVVILCVPLLADQRPVGVLRIRRRCENFDRHEMELLEDLLLESATHIALALKKDEDDRKAITDGLTSLYIKRHFLVVLDVMRSEFAATGNSFCLVLCDIDHFKRVNDSYGHLTGDMILKGVAGVLRAGLRSGDMSFRYGGEELALLLSNCSLERAEHTADRLRAAIEKTIFTGEKGQPIQVTISMGIAQHYAALAADGLISRADRALYASKQAGRNRVTRWSAALPDPVAQAPNAALTAITSGTP